MILNTKADILITYPRKHTPLYYTKVVSGHIFEVFDYYFILKQNNINVKCLIPEAVDKNFIIDFLKNHYSVDFCIDDIFTGYNYTAVKAEKILVTDGSFYFLKNNNFITKQIYAFACGDAFFNPRETPQNIKLLADHKIYPNLGINYTKKVLPYLSHIEGSRPFAHVTKNCRSLNEYQIKQLVEEYPNIMMYSDYLNHPNVVRNPIKNFEFSEYVYTPIMRHFDCSPRLVIECQILGIPFTLWNIDYEDPGLERRLEDYKQFILKEDDEILRILNL